MSINPVNEYVRTAIRRIRLEKGLKVVWMAEHTGIPLGSYSCLETGRYRLNLDSLFRILHALGADITEVWPGEVTKWAKVDDDFINEWIAKCKAGQPPQIELEDIIESVCTTYNITTEQLCSPSHKHYWADARKAAAVLVKETPQLTLVELCRRLDRDPSSLSHALKEADKRLFYDRDFRRRLMMSRRRIGYRLKAKVRERQN